MIDSQMFMVNDSDILNDCFSDTTDDYSDIFPFMILDFSRAMRTPSWDLEWPILMAISVTD